MSRRIALAQLGAIFLLQFVVQSLSRSESTPSAIPPCFLEKRASANAGISARVADASAALRAQMQIESRFR